MDTINWLEVVGLLFFSATKFFLSPSACVLLGYSFVASAVISAIGGCIGFTTFFTFGLFIRKQYQRLFPPKRNKPVFTRRNKFLVHVKKRWGFWGLAVLCPFVLGMPVAGIIASMYYANNRKIIPVFCAVIIGAAFLLSFISVYLKEL